MGINFTNSNKANNDLSSEANSSNTNTDTHTHTTYDDGIQCPGFRQVHTYGGAKPVNKTQPSPLDN